MSRLLRSSWNASMAMGSVCFTNRSVGRSPGSATRGISPRTVAPIRSLTSVTRLSRRLIPAAQIAAKMPRMMPKAAAPTRTGLRGFDGDFGGGAGRKLLELVQDARRLGLEGDELVSDARWRSRRPPPCWCWWPRW